jgi:hypothetical protein
MMPCDNLADESGEVSDQFQQKIANTTNLNCLHQRFKGPNRN